MYPVMSMKYSHLDKLECEGILIVDAMLASGSTCVHTVSVYGGKSTG